MLGVLLRIGGLTQSAFNACSQLRLCCSDTTAFNSIKTLVAQGLESIQRRVGHWVADKQKICVLIGDNYNHLYWASTKKLNESFTETVPSWSWLCKAFTKPEWFDTSAERPAAFPPMDVNALENFFSTGASNIDFGTLFEGVVDNSSASLTKFTPLPSCNAKSSSFRDVIIVIFAWVLVHMFDVLTREVVLIVDPEPILLIAKFSLLLYGPLKYLILAPPMFHYQKHGLESLYSDPLYMLVVFAPFLKYCGHRPSVFKKYQITLLQQMRKKEALAFNAVRDMLADMTSNDDEDVLHAGTIEESKSDIVGGVEESKSDIVGVEESKSEKVIHPTSTSHGQCCMNEVNVVDIVQVGASYINAAIVAAGRKIEKDDPLGAYGSMKTDQQLSYKRLKYYAEELYAAWLIKRSELIDKYKEPNCMILFLIRFFDESLSLFVAPFHSCTVDGNARTFYEKFPAMIYCWVWYRRPKVVRSAFITLLNILHWKSFRPDIIKFLGSTVRWMNDKYIEHHNSRIARILNGLFTKVNFQNIRFASVLSSVKSGFYESIASLLYTADNDAQSSTSTALSDKSTLRKRSKQTSHKKATEPMHESTQFYEGGASHGDVKEIAEKFLVQLFALYENVEESDSIVNSWNAYDIVALGKKQVMMHVDLFAKYSKEVVGEECLAREQSDPSYNIVKYWLEKQTVAILSSLLQRLRCKYGSTVHTTSKKYVTKANLIIAIIEIIPDYGTTPQKNTISALKRICECQDSNSPAIDYIDVDIEFLSEIETISETYDRGLRTADEGSGNMWNKNFSVAK